MATNLIIILVLEIFACVAMWLAALNYSRDANGKVTFSPPNYMCMSFALLITAHLLGLAWPVR